jgi:hypothetical protein
MSCGLLLGSLAGVFALGPGFASDESQKGDTLMRGQTALPGVMLATIALAFTSSAAFAKDKKLPDLTKACAKECPNAASNDEVFKCVEEMENKSGEKAFSKKHKSCYKAHEKYEKMTGKEAPEESHDESHEESHG